MELNHIARASGRLSHILKAEMHISTGLMNRLKWQDRILVNGQSQHTDYAVQAGDTVARGHFHPKKNGLSLRSAGASAPTA